MSFTFRDYQDEAIQAIWLYFANGGKGNPVVAMPTGTGKSLVIAGFIQQVLHSYPFQRIMMLTHVQELIEQNYEKLVAIWPTAPAGVYSAGLGRKDVTDKIIFGGIQSAAKNPAAFGHIDLVIIDECHLVSPKADTSYRTFLQELKKVNPALRVIGLTATNYRLGLGLLTTGGLFSDVCIDLTAMDAFNRFIDEGYLTLLIPKSPALQLDVDQVKKRGGEYIEKDLQDAVDKAEITERAVTEVIACGADRKHWLVFATGIEHAKHITAALEAKGIPASVLHSNLTRQERKVVIADFKAGRIRALVNNNILTTGFDFAGIDLIAVIRPTASPGLWVQMLGRGTRPVYAKGFPIHTAQGRLAAISAGGKPNCLVLDFAGNTKRLGPINNPVIPAKPGEKTGGPPPMKVCQECSCYNHTSKRVCDYCGAEFPVLVKFTATAAAAALIQKKEPPKIERFRVTMVTYQRHRKAGKPDSIRVSYHCGNRYFTTYICMEHGGYATARSVRWWLTHVPTAQVPTTTDIAFSVIERLREPDSIDVQVNLPYPEIINYNFITEETTLERI
jgi:DNA repair protein RadD